MTKRISKQLNSFKYKGEPIKITIGTLLLTALCVLLLIIATFTQVTFTHFHLPIDTITFLSSDFIVISAVPGAFLSLFCIFTSHLFNYIFILFLCDLYAFYRICNTFSFRFCLDHFFCFSLYRNFFVYILCMLM